MVLSTAITLCQPHGICDVVSSSICEKEAQYHYETRPQRRPNCERSYELVHKYAYSNVLYSACAVNQPTDRRMPGTH